MTSYIKNIQWKLIIISAIFLITQLTITVVAFSQTCTDLDSDGYSIEGGSCGQVDCNDSISSINPGETEAWYDGLDQDCNEWNDYDQDMDTYVDFAWNNEAGGTSPGTDDCNDNDVTVNPATYWYLDSDGDSYGNPDISIQQCNQPAGYILNNTDCDDNDSYMHPGGHPTRITGTSLLYFESLQEAYDAVSDGYIVQSRSNTFSGDLNIDRSVSVAITGGYDCGYTAITGNITINGNMTIRQGTVTLDSGTIIINEPDTRPRIVTSTTRLTHPAYQANNLWFGVRDPWNSDHTRILLYENDNYTDPVTGRIGRGLVWGYLNDLKSWTTLEEYEAAAKPIPNAASWESTSIYWSPFTGEENILYGIYKDTRYIMKLDVDTNSLTPVTSYDPADGTDISKARSFGWTKDNTLIVNFDDEEYSSGGYEINVLTGSKTLYNVRPANCSAEGHRWPLVSHGHSHRSPDKTRLAKYGSGINNSGVYKNEYNSDCNTLSIDNYGVNLYEQKGVFIDHVSWKSSNDWFLGASIGYNSWDPATGFASAPFIDVYSIWQVFFDRTTGEFTYNTLIEYPNAGRWQDESGNSFHWNNLPIPTLRNDGSQFIFMNTDGKYLPEDYSCCVNGCPDSTIPQSVCDMVAYNWGTRGIFLADMAVPQCNNGIDDDLDGSKDMADADCDDIYDNNEASGNPPINSPPSLLIYEPDGLDDTMEVDGSFHITYNLNDNEDEVTVAFYHDTDNSGFDGTAISGCGQSAEGYGLTCSWNTAGLQAGSYYIYGMTDDGVNPSVNAYGAGPITIAGGDTLNITNNISIASADPIDGSPDILMHNFQLDSNNMDDGQIELASLNIIDNGTTTNILNTKIYISLTNPSTLPVNAVLIGEKAGWNGTAATILLDNGTVGDRTVISGISKYIYVVYNLAAGEQGKTIQSAVRTVSVAEPDIGVETVGTSNLLAIQPCLPTGSIEIISDQTLFASPIDMTSIVSSNNATNQAYAVEDYSACEIDSNGTYIDAENFTGTISQGTAMFSLENSVAGHTGTGYLRSNGGIYTNCPSSEEGKKYKVYFNTTGTYNVWIKGYATSKQEDSIFIGLDGNCLGSLRESPGGCIGAECDPYFNTWIWTNEIHEGTNALDITTPGFHSINVWIRESEHLLDGIYITQGTETPTDFSYGTETNPATCIAGIYTGNQTMSQSIDTTGWAEGVKGLTVSGNDATCLTTLPTINNDFRYQITAPNDDSLLVSNNTAIVSSDPTDGDTGIVMQRFQVDSNNLGAGNNQVKMTSITLSDYGSVSGISDAKIYISPTISSTLPLDAVLIGNTGIWDGTVSTVAANEGTVSDRTVVNGLSKYIYIIYDLDTGQAGETIKSSVSAVSVAAPDTGSGIVGTSNLLTIQDCLQTGDITLIPGQTLSGNPLDLTPIVTANNVTNQSYAVKEYSACEVDPNGTYLDAEKFSDTITQGTGTFVEDTTEPGYLGTGYLRSNGGTNSYCPPVEEGKNYRLYFPAAGTYNMWIRGYAPSKLGNSLFIGLDGACIGALQETHPGCTGSSCDPYLNQWIWSNYIQNGLNTITVSTPGIHNINIWIRESDHLVDGIYMTQGTETPTDASHGIEIDAANCSTGLFSGDATEAQNIDTTGWVNGLKDLKVTAEDDACRTSIPFANDTFIFNSETDCLDSIDNDHDGDIDCADQDCNGIFVCEFGTELSCFDDIDNDEDGFSDCTDTDCDGANNGSCDTGQEGICASGTITCTGSVEICIQDNQAQQEGPITDLTCSDSLDNDCDGLTDSDPECLCEIPLDDFTDGFIDTGLWKHITSGNTGGSGADTYFLEQNNRLEAQSARHMSSPLSQVSNILQTADVSQGNFIWQDAVVQAQVYWYSDTLATVTPPDSIARVSIVDGISEIILWTAPQEPWTSDANNGLRTAADQRENLMQFNFNASNQTVTFWEDENLIGTFNISSLNAWRIKWYTKGQNFPPSHTSTAKVYISLFQTVTVTGNISIQQGQILTGNPVDLSSIANTSYATNLWYTIMERGACDVDLNGTYIDAVNYTGTILQGTAFFIEESSQTGHLGSAYLRSNGGNTDNCPSPDEGKEYMVNFPSTGTYAVWLRAYASDASSDSIFIGLDGNCVGSLNEDNLYNQWLWTNNIKSGVNSVTVSTAGIHAINIWIRESNHLVDGIYITKDGEIPTDSSHGTEIDPNNCSYVIFSGDVTSAQSIDTTLWVDGEKEFEISGDDESCGIPLTPAHETFNYIQ